MKHPIALKTDIVKRALGGKKEFEQFLEQYNAAKKIRLSRPPEDWEIKLAHEYKKGITSTRLMREYNIKYYNSFLGIISRVYKHEK